MIFGDIFDEGAKAYFEADEVSIGSGRFFDRLRNRRFLDRMKERTLERSKIRQVIKDRRLAAQQLILDEMKAEGYVGQDSTIDNVVPPEGVDADSMDWKTFLIEIAKVLLPLIIQLL